jgi:uncharacterized protein
MKTSISSIKEFTSLKNIALVGASRNDKKFGSQIYQELVKKGKNIYPVNPNVEAYKDVKCYADILSLPDEVEAAILVTPKAETEKMVKQAINKNVKNIWIQQGAETPEAIKIAEESKVNLVHNHCIFMFMEPVQSVHGFHRFFTKLFGKYPK